MTESSQDMAVRRSQCSTRRQRPQRKLCLDYSVLSAKQSTCMRSRSVSFVLGPSLLSWSINIIASSLLSDQQRLDHGFAQAHAFDCACSAASTLRLEGTRRARTPCTEQQGSEARELPGTACAHVVYTAQWPCCRCKLCSSEPKRGASAAWLAALSK